MFSSFSNVLEASAVEAQRMSPEKRLVDSKGTAYTSSNHYFAGEKMLVFNESISKK